MENGKRTDNYLQDSSSKDNVIIFGDKESPPTCIWHFFPRSYADPNNKFNFFKWHLIIEGKYIISNLKAVLNLCKTCILTYILRNMSYVSSDVFYVNTNSYRHSGKYNLEMYLNYLQHTWTVVLPMIHPIKRSEPQWKRSLEEILGLSIRDSYGLLPRYTTVPIQTKHKEYKRPVRKAVLRYNSVVVHSIQHAKVGEAIAAGYILEAWIIAMQLSHSNIRYEKANLVH